MKKDVSVILNGDEIEVSKTNLQLTFDRIDGWRLVNHLPKRVGVIWKEGSHIHCRIIVNGLIIFDS